ncbi:hypothetical protein [Acidihalobacter ferrooxydans]|uniref:Beta-ketoacyl synthase N-terminal domain-containing protein n=1 Tax=Acidihalobacter ferrooxydans TaxID=1765967 RepID=A0A1P8UDZ7_9GAMM|nr:hypothetical protein [Acidihalobacter ferrooxydans]APZ42050.1 hypothetical protein BW247_02180 [Acidihalobacter ferrooxydans]
MTGLRIVAAGGIALAAGGAPTPLDPLYAGLGLKAPRRSSRFTQLALLGARLATAMLAAPLDAGSALYLATGAGNVADTAAVLEGLYRLGEAPMPFAFINVSSNVAGFQIAAALGLNGSNLTVSRRDSALGAALELALADAGSGRLAQAMIGAVDECCWPLDRHRERLQIAADTPLGEGSHWLAVDQTATVPLGVINAVVRLAARPALEAWLRTLPPTQALVPATPEDSELVHALAPRDHPIWTPTTAANGYYASAEMQTLCAALTRLERPFALLGKTTAGWQAIQISRT